MAFKPIQILINAKDNASSVFDKLQAKVMAVGAVILSYFGIQALAGAVKGASDLEAAMSRVQAATDATAGEMQQLKALVQDAGANTRFSAVEAAGALEELGKAGVSAADSVKVLPAVMRLAEASGASLGRATEVTTSIIMGLGLEFTDAARVADVLAMGANATKTSVEGLGQAMSYAAPVAKSLGLSLEFTTAMIGQFAQGGIDASRAGTALNNILSQFADPASKFREQLALIGISTNDFEKALHQLAAAGPAGAAAIQSVGLESGPALRAMLNLGMGALDELKGKLIESAGSAEAAAKIMRDNLEGSMLSLGSIWKTVKNVLSTPVLPVLKDGVDELVAALRRAVGDGTVAKFGESFAVAIQGAIKWVRELVAAVDFPTVLARLQTWADETAAAMTRLSEWAKNTGNAVSLAYNIMAAGANGVLMAIYGIGSVFAEVAEAVMKGVALLREGLSKVTFGGLSESFKLAAEDARSMAQGFGDAAQAMRDKAAQALGDVADRSAGARAAFEGLADGMNKTTEASRTSERAIADMAAQIEKAGQASIASAEKQANATTTTAKAVEKQVALVRELRAELEKAVELRDWQAAAEIQQKLEAAMRSTAQAAAETSAQIAAAAKAVEARNRVIEAALALEHAKEQAYEAEMRAIGNLYAATQSQIRQKEIEIKVIEAKVKAMNAEADASIRVAEAKLREMAANKEVNPVKEAELRSSIELAKAKKLEAEAIEATTGKLRAEITAIRLGTNERDRHAQSVRNVAVARDAATAALERENAARERAIAAQEKANQLLEREDALRRKLLNIDKDGFTLDANGRRMEQSAPSERYVYDTAKAQGLTDEQALALLEEFMPNGKASRGNNGNTGLGASKDWFTLVNEAINRAVIEAARNRVNGTGPAAPPAPTTTTTTSSGSAGQRERGSTGGVTLQINLHPGVDLSNRAEAERMARQLMPAIENLNRRGMRS